MWEILPGRPSPREFQERELAVVSTIRNRAKEPDQVCADAVDVARQALIDQGLKSGDTVVVDGQYRLTEGSQVRELHGKAAREADLQSSVQDALP